MEKYKMCMCFTRKFRIREAQPPNDVKESFFKYSDGKNLMTAEQLHRFLVEFQGESEARIEDGEMIIQQILHRRHHIAQFTRNTLSLDDFHHYLFSEDLNFAMNTHQVLQDMTAPLSHYFIYTGHNSYLTGNQLSSDCSDVPIIEALKKGVRVIELDIWPDSSKKDVHVLHGRTLTTPVPLIKCLKSIKTYAFSTSPYPVIITLEDHLTPTLQAKVAEMVIQTFGDMLFFPMSDWLEEFPSPEALKYRILLSTKPPKEYRETKIFKDKGKDLPEDEAWNKDVIDISDELETEEDSEHNQDGEDVDNGKSGRLGAPEYKRLIAIHAKKHKSGLTKSLKVDGDKVGRLSLSEQMLEKATTSRGTDIVRFTQKNFLRIYPKGTRFDSSNYNPLIGWTHGAQMVACNMQGYGRYLWLMQGMFRSNGGCGYVKKPNLLMKVDSHNRVFDPKAKLPVGKTLRVRVYMGDGWRLDFKQTHFDKFSPPDFYTRVGIAGVPTDVTMKKTKIVEHNWTPVWDEEFCFPLSVPELALLRIDVHEYSISKQDEFGGQTCLLVSELRQGIRTVPLFDRKGEKLKSVKLLMRFEFV